MMNNVYEFTCKNDSLKDKAKAKLHKVTVWFNNNKELAMVLIPTAGAIGASAIKAGGKLGRGLLNNANLRREERVKNCYCYDRSLGNYWELKRKLTTSEWLKVDARRQNGERLGAILKEMDVLK